MMNKIAMERIAKKAADAMAQLKDGKTGVEVAAGLYRRNLPGKSERTAMMMAQHTADTVAAYYRSKAAALENYEAWAEEAFRSATETMDPVQAYHHLYQIYVGAVASAELSHAQTQEEKDAAQTRLQEGTERTFTDDEVTPEALAELKANLAGALQDAGILTSQLDAMLEQLRTEDADAQMVLNYGALTQDVMTVLSMQTYLDAKNGLHPEIPANATLEEITMSVCAAMDTCQVAAQVANGEITEEEGAQLLGTLGAIFGLLVSIPIVMAGGTLAYAGAIALGMHEIIACAAAVVVGVAIYGPVNRGLEGAGQKVGDGIQTVTVFSVKAVIRGIGKLIEALKRGVGALRTRTRERKARIETQEPTEPQAQTEAETEQQPVRARQEAEALA